MIQQQTILKVADNSGAKTVKCIKVLNGFNRRFAVLGDIIIVSIQKLRNKARSTSKVQKGEVHKAIILRTKAKTIKKDGTVFFFQSNVVSLINKQGKPIASRIIGPMPKILKKKKKSQVCNSFFRVYIEEFKMFFLDTYFYNIVKYDLINIFFYQNVKQIPKFEKIILNFGYQKSSFKHLISGLLALEFISSKKSKLTKSKYLNVFLKIKKGSPVGCKIILRKHTMYFFYVKLITSIFPKMNQSQIVHFQQNLKSIKSISIQLKNPLLFKELENQYQFFKDIPNLDITLVTTSKSQNELFFIFKSIKFFI